MSNPRVESFVVRSRKFHQSEGYGNSVNIMIGTKSEEFIENPITGIRTPTGRSTRVSRPIFFTINLHSTSHDHIIRLLHTQFNSDDDWLYTELASFISVTAARLGFGFNGFTVGIVVKITYRNVVVLSDHPLLINHEESSLMEKILRTVFFGRVKRENLKMETESCSICLDDLSDSSPKHGLPTRMSCSHVFHGRCLLEWLFRKNTCPLCRTVLYDP